MMGCSVLGPTGQEVAFDGVPCGVIMGHAYSIIDAFEIVVTIMIECKEGDDDEDKDGQKKEKDPKKI